MDDFTRSHLMTYTDAVVWPDEREAFLAYVERSVADDPTVVDIGWPSLYHGWQRWHD
jgi:hypothetical protein